MPPPPSTLNLTTYIHSVIHKKTIKRKNNLTVDSCRVECFSLQYYDHIFQFGERGTQKPKCKRFNKWRRTQSWMYSTQYVNKIKQRMWLMTTLNVVHFPERYQTVILSLSWPLLITTADNVWLLSLTRALFCDKILYASEMERQFK